MIRTIGIEREIQDPFREQFVPIYLKRRVRKIETEYKSVVSPSSLPMFISPTLKKIASPVPRETIEPRARGSQRCELHGLAANACEARILRQRLRSIDA